MTVAYATEEQLEAYLPAGTTVSDAARLLARASEVLDDNIRGTFALGEDGLPSDTDTATSLADACCAQVEFWLEVGEENDIDSLAGTQITVPGYTGPRAVVLAPRALRFLQAARLVGTSGLNTLPSTFFCDC